jgi:hypothetical protein
MASSTAGGPVVPIASWPVGNPTEYNNPPTLNWYLGVAATGLTYEIQCVPASDPWPADNVFATSSAMSFTMPYDLIGGVQYAWRVRSTNGTLKSNWSDYALFTMVTINTPVQPIAGSPINSVIVNSNSPELFWYLPTAPSEQKYNLSYSASSDMDDAIVVDGINSLSYKLNDLNAGTYFWVVKSQNTDGIFSLESKQGSFVVESTTDVKDNSVKNVIPDKFNLHQNFPNPFNPTTNIGFDIARTGNYSLRLFNVLGQEVAVLANKNFSPGTYVINFNAANLISGIYFYQLTGENVNFIKKMILAK